MTTGPGPVVPEVARERAHRDVTDWFARVEGPGLGRLTRVSGLCVHPGGGPIAVWGAALTGPDTRSERHVVLVDPAGGAIAEFEIPGGSRIAWAGERLITAGATLQSRAMPDGAVLGEFAVPGTVEQLAVSPDGRTSALVIDAGRSDSWDSSVVRTHDAMDFAPEVYTAVAEAPREVWLLDTETGALRQVDTGPWSVWECAWLDDSHLAVIASELAGESGWYHPVLAALDLRDRGADGAGRVAVLHRPSDELQLAGVVAEDGVICVVEGIASDRGHVYGRVLEVRDGVRELPIAADVSHLRLHGGQLSWAGLSGLSTRAGRIDLATGTATALFDGEETFASSLPTLDVDGAGIAYALIESYEAPPRLERLERLDGDGGGRTLVHDFAHAGDRVSARTAGTRRSVSWTAPDGRTIEGIVVVPSGVGPHPLLVTVHGGPTSAWRNRWGMQNGDRHPYAGLLAEHGIATFYPNPRGSVGHGLEFAGLVRGELCGDDVEDLHAGIDHLVSIGIADPTRLAVTGNSYGGQMSAWLAGTSGRFVFSVPTSPASDLISQHHLSNIPAFDELYLGARIEDAPERFIARSPLRHASEVRTPMLITAGLRDKCTPPSQAIELHQAVRRAGTQSELVLYPQQGHGIADFPETIDFLSRLLAWCTHLFAPNDPRRSSIG